MDSLHCLFVSDLHGHARRYDALFSALRREQPDALFLGGDLLPGAGRSAGGHFPAHDDFIHDILAPRFRALREVLGTRYPAVFVIPGNDDPRAVADLLGKDEYAGLWEYLPAREARLASWTVFGYPYVPPTPFRLKDWERFDVSRYVDPGCVAPADGRLTVPRDDYDLSHRTIQDELGEWAEDRDMRECILLMHTPPYDTALDRAGLDGRMVDHVPVDVHVGSIAVQRFIDARQPAVTLHGHVHEAARLTGTWMLERGSTVCIGAAHDGAELALVHFDPAQPGRARRELL